MLKLTGLSFLVAAFAMPVLAATPAAQPRSGMTPTLAQNTVGGGMTSLSPRNDILTPSGGKRASQIIGSAVYNANSEKVGSIDDLIINPNRSLLVTIDVGGFLGIGGKTVAVPFDKLEYVPANGNMGNHLVLPGSTKDELAAMPQYNYATR
jgi:sporulation protein YlmC with PRC-barrel domain